jgi:large subunit ribosomal protein L25
MSEILQLTATTRKEKGKYATALRKTGLIPAVVYGHGIENTNIFLTDLAFGRVLKQAGENTLIALSIDGDKSVNVLIADAQLHPLTGRISHADLFQVRMDEEIEAGVPIEFVGEAPAVKALGGILIRSIDTLEVSCLPANLPHSLIVDLSMLKELDDNISIADIQVPKGVELLGKTDTIVVSVAAPRTEAELAALNEKVEVDVTKVEGVVKETAPAAEAKKEKK